MKKPFLFVLLAVIVLSCKKEAKFVKDKMTPELPSYMPAASSTKIDLYKSLAEFILKTAKNKSTFKSHVLAVSAPQPYDDYYIRVVDLINYNQTHSNVFWSSSEQTYLQGLVNSIKNDDSNEPYEPIVFVPFLEDRNLDSLLQNLPSGSPEGVVQFEYNSRTEECPAYTLNESDQLISSGTNINEAYAWDHNVWVFGQEENVPTGTGGAGIYNAVQGDRYDGIPEYGGIIQIPDIGAVEPWVSGKLELKYFIFDQSGTKIKEKAFAKTKRKKFKDNAWVDFNDFICYWNLSNIGNWMIESWIEVDGGNSTSTVSQTIPPPCTGCASTTISFTKQNRDDEMGQTLIQFSDPYSTVYGISYANVKRKTQ
jgi:hypothetical protein